MKNKTAQNHKRVNGGAVEEINEEFSPDTIEKWDSLKHMNLILSPEEIVEMLSVEIIIETLNEKGIQ
jgi:acyl carrier protein